MITATTPDAYSLLHRGSLAFARMEENGLRIDVPYVKATIKQLGKEIKETTEWLKKDDVWKVWQKCYPRDAKLGSDVQLARVMFKELGYQSVARTESGDRESTAESAFRGINLPFVRDYFRIKKLHKLRKTYFEGILSEEVDGCIHPSFNLHTTVTFRSSASGPNYHNIPARDPELGKMIRRAFIARDGNHLVEMDLAGAEVRVAYCYHQDPTMRKYLLDPNTDMHRDTAAELLSLPVEYLKTHAQWAKRGPRDWAKNRFVFPEFYGSVYFQCAPHLWEAISELESDPDNEGQTRYRSRLPDSGKPLVDHLAESGVGTLGRCQPGAPTQPGTFEARVKKVEQAFWQERFPVYTEWKERSWRNYQAKGYFDTFTGFRCGGLMRRNQVLNTPIQGVAFHLILLACILMQEWLDKHNMESRIVGQIHDSQNLCVPPHELQDVLNALRHIITVVIPKRWPWIIIPIEVEAEVCDPGEAWSNKRVWTQNETGEWRKKG